MSVSWRRWKIGINTKRDLPRSGRRSAAYLSRLTRESSLHLLQRGLATELPQRRSDTVGAGVADLGALAGWVAALPGTGGRCVGALARRSPGSTRPPEAEARVRPSSASRIRPVVTAGSVLRAGAGTGARGSTLRAAEAAGATLRIAAGAGSTLRAAVAAGGGAPSRMVRRVASGGGVSLPAWRTPGPGDDTGAGVATGGTVWRPSGRGGD